MVDPPPPTSLLSRPPPPRHPRPAPDRPHPPPHPPLRTLRDMGPLSPRSMAEPRVLSCVDDTRPVPTAKRISSPDQVPSSNQVPNPRNPHSQPPRHFHPRSVLPPPAPTLSPKRHLKTILSSRASYRGRALRLALDRLDPRRGAGRSGRVASARDLPRVECGVGAGDCSDRGRRGLVGQGKRAREGMRALNLKSQEKRRGSARRKRRGKTRGYHFRSGVSCDSNLCSLRLL